LQKSVMKGTGTMKLLTRNVEYIAAEIKFQRLIVLIHSNDLILFSV